MLIQIAYLFISFCHIANDFRFLVCEREERGIAEKIAKFILKPFQHLAPTLITTPTDTLAKAMVNNTINTNAPKTEIVENAQIFELASLYNNQ